MLHSSGASKENLVDVALSKTGTPTLCFSLTLQYPNDKDLCAALSRPVLAESVALPLGMPCSTRLPAQPPMAADLSPLQPLGQGAE